MRDRLLLLSLAAALASCTWGGGANPPPRLDEVVPGTVLAGVPASISLRGENLFATLRPGLTAGAPHRIDDGFEVRLGGLLLPKEDVRLLDSATLEVAAPALAVGTYDVSVRTPAGLETTLTAALSAVPPVHHLSFLTPEVQLAAGDCSGEVRVELQDFAGRPAVLESATFVYLSADRAEVRFFRDPACTRPADRISVVPGGSTASFHVAGHLVGESALAAGHGELRAIQPARFTLAQRCAASPLLEGVACDDGLDCTSREVCSGGLCQAPELSACPPPIPPRACFRARPRAARPGEAITFDPSCTTDADDPPAQLRVRYDFEADGTWDTGWAPLEPLQHAYSRTGAFEPLAEVTDPRGAADATGRLLVLSEELVEVTTPLDESTAGATPQSPGGAGLSLREAVGYANTRGGSPVIWIPDGLQLTTDAALALTASRASIVGGEGARLDFLQSALAACLELQAEEQRVIGLQLTGCQGQLVRLLGQRSQVADCWLQGPAAAAIRIAAQAVVVGPRNRFTGFAAQAVQVSDTDSQIRENRFEHNGEAVVAFLPGSGGNQLLARNVFANNAGVAVSSWAAPGFVAWCNTFHGNGADAIRAETPSSRLEVRNNVFAQNAGYGIAVPPAMLSSATPNAFFANGLGEASGLSPQKGWVTAAPGFLDVAGGDLRPAPGSPLINAGVDLSLDVNGPAPGRFFGSAPDLGAFETR